MITLPPKADVVRKLIKALGDTVVTTGMPYTSMSILITDTRTMRPLIAKEVKTYNAANQVHGSEATIGITLSKNPDGSYVLVCTDHSETAIDELVGAIMQGGEAGIHEVSKPLTEDEVSIAVTEAYDLFMELDANSDGIISAMYCHLLASVAELRPSHVVQVLDRLYESATSYRTILSPERDEILGTYEFYAAELEGHWYVYYDTRSNIDVFKDTGHPNAKVSAIVDTTKEP